MALEGALNSFDFIFCLSNGRVTEHSREGLSFFCVLFQIRLAIGCRCAFIICK